MQLLLDKTFNEVMDLSMKRLAQTQISEVGPGGIARLLITVINDALANDDTGFYTTLRVNHLQAFLSTATGEFLDAIGYLLNCTRKIGENDSDYKYRISKQVLILEKANQTAVRLAALSVNTVKDVIMKPFTHGTGSFSIYIITDSPNPGQEIIDAAQTAINEVKGYGIRAEVFIPTIIPVELTGKIIFNKKASETDRRLLVIDITQKVKDYINGLTVGQPLIINEVIQVIMSISDLILDFKVTTFKINNRSAFWVNQEIKWNERLTEGIKTGAIQFN